jgi:putative transposase
MSRTKRKEMINRDCTNLSLTHQCKLLKISRSSLYYTPVGFDAETLALMNEIDRVFTKYPFFGSRQIAAYLPRAGFHAGPHRVRRLMGIMGLQAIYKGPNTSKKHPQYSLTLFASRPANHPCKPCLVFRYYLQSRCGEGFYI